MAPDRSYTNRVTFNTRIRSEWYRSRDQIEAFRVQLEYAHRTVDELEISEPGWYDVARFDHSPNSPSGHDITREGLHMDICLFDEVLHRETDFPNQPPLSEAVRWCELYFLDNHARLVENYEMRAGVPKMQRMS